ncbi:MAG: helix-turn-helix domain-containing protein [Pseudobdellovibrio sp.]|nr:helix-turn-helix domain-containing protein [Pseudobdellovibrio sp.]
MKVQIGPVLKKLLKDRRMTLKEVSTATSVPSSTLSEWLNNRSPKNPEQTLKVAQYLEVSLHYLLFGEEDHQEPLTKILKEDVFSGTFEINIKRVRSKNGD